VGRGDDDLRLLDPCFPEDARLRAVAAVDGEPCLVRALSLCFVVLDDHDELASPFQSLGQGHADTAPADDYCTHWCHSENLTDLSCQSGLDRVGREDDDEHCPEQRLSCLDVAGQFQFDCEQRCDARGDDAPRTHRRQEQPFRAGEPLDADGCDPRNRRSDNHHDGDHEQEAADAEAENGPDVDECRKGDEHEPEGDQRHVPAELLHCLPVWEVEVAERDAGRRCGGDAGLGGDGLRDRERADRGAQQQKPGSLGCLLWRDLVAQQEIDQSRHEQTGGDADTEPLQKGKDRRENAQIVEQQRLEDDDGRDCGGNVVDDPFRLESGGDVFPDVDDLENRCDDRRSRRNQQCAHEEGQLPFDPLQEPDRDSRPEQHHDRADSHQSQGRRLCLADPLEPEGEGPVEDDDRDAESDNRLEALAERLQGDQPDPYGTEEYPDPEEEHDTRHSDTPCEQLHAQPGDEDYCDDL